MAGTLTISTLSDGTNSVNATNLTKGSCYSWVCFGYYSSMTIRGSYNVSSVTRNSTGDYTVNFTTALPNYNYACITNSGQADAARNTTWYGQNNGGLPDSTAPEGTTKLTTSCKVYHANGHTASSWVDVNSFSVLCVA